MPFIEEFKNSCLKNSEDFQHKTEVRDLILDIGAENLGIEKLFNNVYMPAYNDFNAAYNKEVKSALTEQIWVWDTNRDNIITSTKDIAKANLRNPSEEKQAAAKRLIIKLDSFGSFLDMSLNGETGAITNLLDDFAEGSKLLADAKLLGIDGWLTDLAAANEKVNSLVKERFNETAGKFDIPVKQARCKINNGYKMVCNQAEILIAIEGIEKYKRFVNMLNAINRKYGSRRSASAGDSDNSASNNGSTGGEEEKYPNAREWSEDIDYQTCASGDIFYIVRNGVKEYYKLLDFGEVATFEPGMDDGGIWEKL